jgi:hypothetical protein
MTTSAAMDGPNKRYIDPPSQSDRAAKKNSSAQTAQTNEEPLIDRLGFAVALWLVANDRPFAPAMDQPLVFVRFPGNSKS